MIFLDTSAIYALADAREENHDEAIRRFGIALERRETFLIHSYVLVEAMALIQRRLGLRFALQFLLDAEAFELHWVTPENHRQAVRLLAERGKRQLSLVDCMSFVVMRLHGISTALAFDSDFESEGFSIFPA